MKRFSPEFTAKLRRRMADFRLMSNEAVEALELRRCAQGPLFPTPSEWVSIEPGLAFRVYQGTMFKY